MTTETVEVSARELELKQAIEAFLITYHQYLDTGAEHITASMSDSTEALLDIWDCGRTGSMNNAVQKAYHKILGAWQEFNAMGYILPKDAYFHGITELEEAIKATEGGHEFKTEMPPESMQQLVKEKLTHEQIARLYGLVHPWPNGRVRVDLVQQELDNPKSVITEDYIHPADLLKKGKLEKAKALMASIVKEEEQSVRTSEKAESDVCPESSYELWLSGQGGGTAMGLSQASMMLKQTEEEISKEWEKFSEEAKALAAKKKAEPKVTKELKDARSKASAAGIGYNHLTTLEVLRGKLEEVEAAS